MQAVIAISRETFRHRLDTLAIARSDEARNIDPAHQPPLLMTKLSTNGFSQSVSAISSSTISRTPVKVPEMAHHRKQPVNLPK